MGFTLFFFLQVSEISSKIGKYGAIMDNTPDQVKLFFNNFFTDSMIPNYLPT